MRFSSLIPVLVTACFHDQAITPTPDMPPPADTAAQGATWRPGDDIPGWDDYPCEAELKEYPSVAWIELPTLSVTAQPACLYEDDAEYVPCDDAERPGNIFAYFCEQGDAYSCYSPDAETCYVRFAGDHYVWHEPRGLGWYDFTTWGPQRSGNAILRSADYGVWDIYDSARNSGGYDPIWPMGAGCLSRVRPDALAGLVVFEIDTDGYPDSPAALIFTFDIHFPEHGGEYLYSGGLPDEVDATHYIYSVVTDYDAFWPWNDITDPDVRRQVYDMYTPYGF